MKLLKIGIDMDGVIADWFDAARKTIKKEWGLELKDEDMIHTGTLDILNEKIPELRKISYEYIYSKICPPGFFYELKPYKGAIEAIKLLSTFAEIIFITKPLEYKYSTDEKVQWLKKYLPDIKYKVIFVDTQETKNLINVDIIIDDDSRVIKTIKNSHAIMINQPWNLIWRKEHPEQITFCSFSDVVNYIERNYNGTCDF